MQAYYFTYGSDTEAGAPFAGGWTKVIAETEALACGAFQAAHANKLGSDFLNCAGIYTEGSFKKTRMYTEGNFGAYCHETITIEITKGDK